MRTYYNYYPIFIFIFYPFIHNRVILCFNLCVLPVYFGIVNAKILREQTLFKKVISFMWILVFLGCAYIIECGMVIGDAIVDSDVSMLVYCYKVSICIYAGIYFLLKGITKFSLMAITSTSAVYNSSSIIVWIFNENYFIKFFEPFFTLDEFSVLHLIMSIFTLVWCIYEKARDNFLFKICFWVNVFNVMLWIVAIIKAIWG